MPTKMRIGFAWVVLLAVLRLTTKAHLAALSVEYGAAICSYDTDFSRFPGVTLIDPDRDRLGESHQSHESRYCDFSSFSM
jgi:hypothetical protein